MTEDIGHDDHSVMVRWLSNHINKHELELKPAKWLRANYKFLELSVIDYLTDNRLLETVKYGPRRGDFQLILTEKGCVEVQLFRDIETMKAL